MLRQRLGIQICENPEHDTKLVWLVSHVLREPAPNFGGEQMLINGEYSSGTKAFWLFLANRVGTHDINANLSFVSL